MGWGRRNNFKSWRQYMPVACHRRLAIEPLEDRTLLSATPNAPQTSFSTADCVFSSGSTIVSPTVFPPDSPQLVYVGGSGGEELILRVPFAPGFIENGPESETGFPNPNPTVSDPTPSPLVSLPLPINAPVLLAPAVSGTETLENTQTTSGLVIMPWDVGVATNFQITNIRGGALFQNDGTTVINNGDFITIAQGAAGLKFTPTPNSIAGGSFEVHESIGTNTAEVGQAANVVQIFVSPQFGPYAKISTRATDLQGNPISSIPVGGTFLLETDVQDICNPVSQFDSGVFAAYLNVSYDASLASIATNATVKFDPFFPLCPASDLSTPGLISETGAASVSLKAPGTAIQKLWTVQVTAMAAGIEQFVPTFDPSMGHDVLLYGINDSVLQNNITFDAGSVQVTPVPSASGISPLASENPAAKENAGASSGQASSSSISTPTLALMFAPLPGAGSGNGLVASALVSLSQSPAPSASLPSIVTRLPQADLNHGPMTAPFQNLAYEETPKATAILVQADQVADALGLDDEVVDGLVVGLGLE